LPKGFWIMIKKHDGFPSVSTPSKHKRGSGAKKKGGGGQNETEKGSGLGGRGLWIAKGKNQMGKKKSLALIGARLKTLVLGI